MPSTYPSAIEIDRKLRDDFRRRAREYGISVEATDPILSVLFRTFAQQLEQLYTETDRIRLTLLDELINNLAIEPRMARPAQTVVRFFSNRGARVIPAGTELVGNTRGGDRITFLTDSTVTVSEARLAFALAYQDDLLRLLPSVELPEYLQEAKPSLEPVRANLGANPCLFLAFENLPPAHLGEHGLFFELGPDAYRIEQALRTEPWSLIGDNGELNSRGILRPKGGNAGVRLLRWLVPESAPDLGEAAPPEQEVPVLPSGFYGPRSFVFPPIPPSRRTYCKVPRAMDSSLAKIFGRESKRVLDVERAWLRILLPNDVPPLHNAVGATVMHSMTASNVECFNQTIVFEKQGTSIPIVREEGGAVSQLVGPLSIFGESGASYISEAESVAKEGTGRYAVRNGRIELSPARRSDGQPESYANVRLWVTHGKLGNTVDPGQVTTLLKGQVMDARLLNINSAAGGTDQEELATAQSRFAAALLSRNRIVTQSDLQNAVRAFDPRIRNAEIEPGAIRTEEGLNRLERIKVQIDPQDFSDVDTEVAILKSELAAFLGSRFPVDTRLSIEVSAS